MTIMTKINAGTSQMVPIPNGSSASQLIPELPSPPPLCSEW